VDAPIEPEEYFVWALSIDLESWVHRRVASSVSSGSKKKLDQGYIEKATLDILNLLDRQDRKITFFVVSEIFDWYPDVIQEIKTRGHEVAYHTHTHRYIRTAKDLAEELKQSRSFIREFEPIGFRAPEARISAVCLKILVGYGFEYDSSSYGNLDTSVMIHGVREIPISTFKFLNSPDNPRLPRNITKRLLCRELPLGSAFFMSALGPAAKVLPNALGFQNKVPVTFIHPWQIMTLDTDPLTSERDLFKRTALLLYSRRCLGPLIYLLNRFQTIRMKDLAHSLTVNAHALDVRTDPRVSGALFDEQKAEKARE
jgi:peptidoglycan/xylan/chitin deacetylase (PgdA/CDA1 family)